jgi:hypothetical protein
MKFYRIADSIFTSRKKLEIIKKNRFDTAPIVSGDGFMNICDYFLKFNSFRLDDLSNYQACNERINIFIEASSLEDDNNKSILMGWIKHFNFSFNIILHNGDLVPEYKYLKELVIQGASKVFCVNILDKDEKIVPIPIGIENLHYLNNGLIDFEIDKHENHNSKKIIKIAKDLNISARFNIDTNYFERSKLAAILENKNGKEYKLILKKYDYKKEVERARFVLSPPGNGMDCHRTWEALAMGSIPVVKNGFLAESIIDNMPIISVKNWEDFLYLSENEMIELYDSFMGKTTEKLYLSYWCRKIFS